VNYCIRKSKVRSLKSSGVHEQFSTTDAGEAGGGVGARSFELCCLEILKLVETKKEARLAYEVEDRDCHGVR